MDVVFAIISTNISCQQLLFLFYTKVVELFSLCAGHGDILQGMFNPKQT